MHLDRAQRWPNGIAALTPQAVPQALLALHAALRAGLERLDVATEARRWRPHLTLARHSGESAAPAKASPVHWQVRGYALVESQAVTQPLQRRDGAHRTCSTASACQVGDRRGRRRLRDGRRPGRPQRPARAALAPDEARIAVIFADGDRGALPALGMAWGVETIIDDALETTPVVHVEAGDHERLPRLHVPEPSARPG